VSAPQEVHVVLLSNDPNRVFPALSLVLGAQAMGVPGSLYCAQAGLDTVLKEKAEKIQLPGYPPASKFVRDAISSGAYVCACAPSKQILEQMGVGPDTVIEGVRLEDVITFLSRALAAAKNGGIVTFI
jgi:predicted peroxiredoxin